MNWSVEYTATATRQLRKLDRPIAQRIIDTMEQRIAHTDDPRCMGKALTGTLTGLWRYRIGDYRLICTIQDVKLCVLVIEIGHRREIYRD